MSSLSYVCCCFLFVIHLQTSTAVVRPDHFPYISSRKAFPESSANGTKADDGPSETRPQIPSPTHYITAQHCCKIGEYISDRRGFCRLDQSIRTNSLTKGKRHPRQPVYVNKDLQNQVAECHQHKHLLQKCCLNRRMYLRELKFCEDNSNWLERVLLCQREVRKKYGYRD